MEFTDIVPATQCVSVNAQGTLLAVVHCVVEEGRLMGTRKIAAGVVVPVETLTRVVALDVRDFGSLQTLARVELPRAVVARPETQLAVKWCGSAIIVIGDHLVLVYDYLGDTLLKHLLTLKEPAVIRHAGLVDSMLVVGTDCATQAIDLATPGCPHRALLAASDIVDSIMYHPAIKAIVAYHSADGVQELWRVSLREEQCQPSHLALDRASHCVIAVFADFPSPSLAVMFAGKHRERAFYRPAYDGVFLGLLAAKQHACWLAMVDGERRMHVMNTTSRSFLPAPLALVDDLPPSLVAYRELTGGKYEAVYARHVLSILPYMPQVF